MMRRLSGRQVKDVYKLFKGCCSIKDKMGRSWRLREDPEPLHGVCMQCWGVSTLLKVIGHHFDQMDEFGGFHIPLASWAKGSW